MITFLHIIEIVLQVVGALTIIGALFILSTIKLIQINEDEYDDKKETENTSEKLSDPRKGGTENEKRQLTPSLSSQEQSTHKIDMTIHPEHCSGR